MVLFVDTSTCETSESQIRNPEYEASTTKHTFNLDCSHGDPRAMAPMGNPDVDCSHGDPRAMAPMGNPDVDCIHGDPRAMAPMGNPFYHRLWLGSNGEIHVKSRKGNLTMIFCRESLGNNVQVYKIKRFCTSYSMCNKFEQICAKQN